MPYKRFPNKAERKDGMKTKNIMKAFSICAVLFVSWPAEAGTNIDNSSSLQKMTAASDHIVIAQVVVTKSYYGPKRQKIYTDVTLEINETIKGRLQKSDRIQITLWGGTVDGITTFVTDYPEFSKNQESVLFFAEKTATKTEKKHFQIVSLSGGKFDISTDPKTNEKRIINTHTDSLLKLKKNGTSLPIANSQAIELSRFLDHIRTVIK